MSCPLGKRALLRTLVAETVTASFEPVAPNADVTPAGVLPRQAKDEDDDIVVQGIGRALAAAREGPGPSDELPCQRRCSDEGRPQGHD